MSLNSMVAGFVDWARVEMEKIGRVRTEILSNEQPEQSNEPGPMLKRVPARETEEEAVKDMPVRDTPPL